MVRGIFMPFFLNPKGNRRASREGDCTNEKLLLCDSGE